MIEECVLVLKKGLSYLYYFCLVILLYGLRMIKIFDRPVVYGKANGLCVFGWRWVVMDYKGYRQLDDNRNVSWPVSPRQTVIQPGKQSISCR